MPTIVPKPVLMSAAVLELGDDNYELVVSSAELAPTTPTQQFKGIGGSIVNVVGKASWMLNLAYAQDFATAGSLSRFLLEHAGEEVPFTLTPVADGPGYSGKVLALPGSIGGAVDTVLAGSVSLPVNGQPEPTAGASSVVSESNVAGDGNTVA